MNVRFRALTVLSALSFVACTTDPVEAPAAKVAVAQKARELTTPKIPVEDFALAAIAPVPPKTVLDTLPVAPPAQETATEVTPASIDFAHEEPLDKRGTTVEEVHVKRFVLSTDVTGHEPLDEQSVFGADTAKIFAFVELENTTGEPYAFAVHFEPKDSPALPYGILLDVKTSPRFRTWAYTKARREPGMYKAVLRTLDGEDIASKDFEIIPSPQAF